MSRDAAAAPVVAMAAVLAFLNGWRAWRLPREQGFDPGDEEPDQVVMRGLEQDRVALRAGFHQLRVEAVASRLGDDDAIRDVRSIGLLVIAGGLVPVVRRVHQRLLTRWPRVDDDAVESCRMLESGLHDLLAGLEPCERVELADGDLALVALTLARLGSEVIDGPAFDAD